MSHTWDSQTLGRHESPRWLQKPSETPGESEHLSLALADHRAQSPEHCWVWPLHTHTHILTLCSPRCLLSCLRRALSPAGAARVVFVAHFLGVPQPRLHPCWQREGPSPGAHPCSCLAAEGANQETGWTGRVHLDPGLASLHPCQLHLAASLPPCQVLSAPQVLSLQHRRIQPVSAGGRRELPLQQAPQGTTGARGECGALVGPDQTPKHPLHSSIPAPGPSGVRERLRGGGGGVRLRLGAGEHPESSGRWGAGGIWEEGRWGEPAPLRLPLLAFRRNATVPAGTAARNAP